MMNRREFIKAFGVLSLVPLATKIKLVESLASPIDPIGWFIIDGVKVESLGVMPRFYATEWDSEGNETNGNVFQADVYRLTKEVEGKTLESYSLIDKLLIDAAPSPKGFVKLEISSHVKGMNMWAQQDN